MSDKLTYRKAFKFCRKWGLVEEGEIINVMTAMYGEIEATQLLCKLSQRKCRSHDCMLKYRSCYD